MSESGVALEAIWHVITDGLSFLQHFVPTLVGALSIVLFGWIFSHYVANLCMRLLVSAGFENVASKTGMSRFLMRSGSNWTASKAVAEIAKWILRLVTIQVAATVLNMPQITEVINSVVMFTPKILVAAVILAAGLMLGNFLAKAARGSFAEMGIGNPELFSGLVYYAVTGFSILAALSHLEIAPMIINTLFIGIVGSVGLAVGLSFGLGGRDVASEMTKKWYEKAKQRRGQTEINKRVA